MNAIYIKKPNKTIQTPRTRAAIFAYVRDVRSSVQSKCFLVGFFIWLFCIYRVHLIRFVWVGVPLLCWSILQIDLMVGDVSHPEQKVFEQKTFRTFLCLFALVKVQRELVQVKTISCFQKNFYQILSDFVVLVCWHALHCLKGDFSVDAK